MVSYNEKIAFYIIVKASLLAAAASIEKTLRWNHSVYLIYARVCKANLVPVRCSHITLVDHLKISTPLHNNYVVVHLKLMICACIVCALCAYAAI